MSRAPSKRVLHDVVVIGSQLGGLVAAALLAKRGHRVLVVDHDGLGEGYRDGGYLLPYAPALIPPFKSIPAAEAVFGELGMLSDLGRHFSPHDPELQVLLARHRFDLCRDPARRARELAREFSDAKAADSAWTSLAMGPDLAESFFKSSACFPPQGRIERWKHQRMVRADAGLQRATETAPPGGHPLAAVAGELAAFLSYLEGERFQGLAISRVLGQWIRGPQKMAGGLLGLRALLHRRIRELGSEVLGTERPAIAEELQFDGSHVASVKLVADETLHVGRAFICGTDVQAFRRLLPPQARKKHLSEQLDAVRLKRFLLAVNLVLPADQVPVGLASLGVLAPESEDFNLLVYEALPAQKDDGKSAPDEKVICAAGLVPAQSRDLGDGHLEALSRKIGDVMLGVLPFAKPKAVSVPLLVKGGPRGARLSPHPLFEIDEPAELGVSGLAFCTPVKNLFLASREVLPGLGLEGELVTASRVAHRVQGLLKKKDPLAAA